MDLSSSHNQNPFPQLGIITGFRGPGQAELRYGFKEGRFRTVNRPLSKLSKLVSADEQIPPEGLLFDPLIMDDYLQAEEAEELDDNNEDVDNDGEEHTSHQDDGADQEGGEDRTRDAGDQDDAGQEQQQEQQEQQQQQQEKGQAAERFEHGATRAKDALGAGGSDQAQGQEVGKGQHGLITRNNEVTVFGTQGQSVQHDAASEPLTGRRKKVRTTHFWNR